MIFFCQVCSKDERARNVVQLSQVVEVLHPVSFGLQGIFNFIYRIGKMYSWFYFYLHFLRLHLCIIIFDQIKNLIKKVQQTYKINFVIKLEHERSDGNKKTI